MSYSLHFVPCPWCQSWHQSKSTPPQGGAPTPASLLPVRRTGVCAQGGSLRPQAGWPGTDYSLPFMWVFQLTVSAAFLLFVSASGSRFLRGAVARVADGCPAAGLGESGPGRRPGRRRGNVQCDVSVPVGPGAVGGVCGPLKGSPFVFACCAGIRPPRAARPRVWTKMRPCRGWPTCWTGHWPRLVSMSGSPSSPRAVPSQAHEAATMTVSPSCWTPGCG